MEEEYIDPPLLVSITAILLVIAVIISIIGATYGIIKHYVDAYLNKKYYNRNLLALASKVIKADGTANKVEIKFVRNYFISNYGERKAKKAFRQFKGLILDKVSTEKTCKKVLGLFTYNERFDFIEFLFGIAYSDGEVTQDEELVIREIASYLYLKKDDYQHLHSIFFKRYHQQSYSSNYYQNNDYKYEDLGLSESATDSEIKKAYRALAKKYHPDKFQNASEEDKQASKEKFQKIQLAYERIKKQRRF